MMPSNLTKGVFGIAAILWSLCLVIATLENEQFMLVLGLSIFSTLLSMGIAHDLYRVQEYFEFPEATEAAKVKISEVGKMDVYTGHVCPMQDECVFTYREADLCPEEWRCNKIG